jgi:hypothetical protein
MYSLNALWKIQNISLKANYGSIKYIQHTYFSSSCEPLVVDSWTFSSPAHIKYNYTLFHIIENVSDFLISEDKNIN